MGILTTLKSIKNILLFVFRNIYKTFRLKTISLKIQDALYYRGLDKNNRLAAFNLYCKYSGNHKISLQNKIVWTYLGRKLCFVIEDKNKNVLGINFYYFNKRDYQERTIHEAFIGISETARGKGLATALRTRTISHFGHSFLKGISSRVSLNNEASLKSALKLGFKPIEKYYDENMNEERYYLVCNFKENHDKY